MRVLITGGSGQLGAALQDTAPPDYAIEAIDRSDLDLTDEVAVQEWILADRPDIVINAAAYSAVDKAETDERLARKVNADAVWAMSLALASTGGKLVQMSTDFVFDGCSFTAYRPAQAQPAFRLWTDQGRRRSRGGKQGTYCADVLAVQRRPPQFCAYHARFDAQQRGTRDRRRPGRRSDLGSWPGKGNLGPRTRGCTRNLASQRRRYRELVR